MIWLLSVMLLSTLSMTLYSIKFEDITLTNLDMIIWLLFNIENNSIIINSLTQQTIVSCQNLNKVSRNRSIIF